MNILALLLSSLLAAPAGAASGKALVKGTAEGSPIEGTVSFEDTKAGLKVVARLSGVPIGAHGFHLHEFGSCADAGKAAGGHYNPRKAPHGHAIEKGPKKAHAGDLGNIIADAGGNAVLEAVLPKVSLAEGRYTVGGRAVILHEKADDFSQPLGNAGARIGCGLITLGP